ncbi:MAG TPA: hypothetical protein VK024_03550 [Actinomycetaceae bacterium]|nr:hypothetical protein [Actinomycetaceae bacterium]
MRRRSRRELDRLAEAPTLADFRSDARAVRNDHLTGAVILDSYFTFGALGAGLVLLLFGVYGAATAPVASGARTGAMWLTLVAIIITTLVVVRLVRLMSNARQVRDAVDALSEEMERRAASGDLPAQPADWEGPMPPAVDAVRRSWV